MALARISTVLLIAPLLVAWSAGGSGHGRWEDGRRVARTVELSGLVEAGADIRIVANASVDDGEALIFVTVPALRTGDRIPVSDSALHVAYQEFAPDGALRFAAERAQAGWVETSVVGERVTVSFDITWHDPQAADSHRRWFDTRLMLGTAPPDRTPSPASGGRHTPGAGYEATVAHDPFYDDSSGCEGDDWSADESDDWDDGEGTGCEGDDLGDGGDYDDGGGCEGDDLSDGSGDDSSASCEGDAIASVGPPRRSPTIVRLINQLPWLLVLVGLRVGRRRRR